MSNPTTKRVAELEDELHALAEHSVAEARRLREAEATIDRVRRVAPPPKSKFRKLITAPASTKAPPALSAPFKKP